MSYSPYAPAFIFGLSSFFGGFLTIFLPETSDVALPDTLEVEYKSFMYSYLRYL